jgi:hypothetical protein
LSGSTVGCSQIKIHKCSATEYCIFKVGFVEMQTVMSFKIITRLQIMSVWNITPYNVVEIYRCFKVYWCHHIQGERMLLIVTAVRTSSYAWNVLKAHTAVW